MVFSCESREAPMPQTIDATVEAAIKPFADGLAAFIFYEIPIAGMQIPWIVLWLAVAATFFTVYLGFLNFRGFPLA
ncbi:MAG: AGCS family alanine or glycine:cation symporter, partial [Congregibacter sp.]